MKMIVASSLSPVPFVAVIKAVETPCAVGVPLIVPVVAWIVSPPGNPVAAHPVGVFDAAIACEKVTPWAMMRGLAGVVITGMAIRGKFQV